MYKPIEHITIIEHARKIENAVKTLIMMIVKL